mmetsp:Transcript_61101/g.177130  ORF Transcript_61101/g.177130 Transcript_61101/m.177130 type:complete len:706 (-) Transcript_61101:161-2278(-)
MAMILDTDALAIHDAIHSAAVSVMLSDGKNVSVEKGKLRFIQVGDIKAMEQNKAKPSKWSTMAKEGSKITWFVRGGPSQWGRIVDGKIDQRGNTIAKGKSSASSSSGKSVLKKPSAADVKAAPADSKEAEEVKEPPMKKAKTVASDPKPTDEAEDKAKTKGKAKAKADPKGAMKAKPMDTADDSGPDPLCLAALFEGSGHGAVWGRILRPVIQAQPKADQFIGPSRNKRTVPVRELTFQALKPNPPSGWKVVSFGQSPFPRLESATGIAHFDNAIKSWQDSRFGAVTTMRCIIKAAAMHKYKVSKATTTAELRALMKEKSVVGPSEWFQAMLSQGVLFMNAACTLVPPETGSVRAGSVSKEHTLFWQPTIEAIVKAILEECRKNTVGIVFAWWGSESLTTKRMLDKCCFHKFADVQIRHIDHKNPAAMADAFCDEPNIFATINKELASVGHGEIDWLPNEGWQERLGLGSSADAMGDFIAETQALHKMYLERLRDGLDNVKSDLADITGVMDQPLVTLANALSSTKVAKPAAARSVTKAADMDRGSLTVQEAASVHMYTTNYLYKALNEALRSADRGVVQTYFLYLRLLLTALQKMPASDKMLYRGVALDLSKDYPANSDVTWWAVSSCTPSLAVAKGFGGGSKVWTLFVIKSRTSVGIRELSEYRHEEEYVLAPGTQFRVTAVKREGTCIEIHMEELGGQKRVR